MELMRWSLVRVMSAYSKKGRLYSKVARLFAGGRRFTIGNPFCPATQVLARGSFFAGESPEKRVSCGLNPPSAILPPVYALPDGGDTRLYFESSQFEKETEVWVGYENLLDGFDEFLLGHSTLD